MPIKGARDLVGQGLAMFEAVGDHPQCQRLSLRTRVHLARSIEQYSGQCGYFRNPATVFLLFTLYPQHGASRVARWHDLLTIIQCLTAAQHSPDEHHPARLEARSTLARRAGLG
jgi:hypothetical protein